MAEQRALSQWEIDALLNDLPGDGAVEDDGGSTRRDRSAPSAIRSYDFRRPDKFSKEQWATLQSIHEHFARILSASFSSRLRTMVSVRLSSLEQGLYEEWQVQVPSPTICYVMSMRPLSGNMVVEFNAELAAEVVERLLGGNGALIDRDRELGEVELGLLRSFSRVFSLALQEMWSTVRPVEPTLQDIGQDASLIQVAGPTDVALTASFEMSIGNHRGLMSLCIPYQVIEPLTPSLSAQLWMTSGTRHAISDDERHAMESLIGRSKVDLSVALGAVDLPARTIAGLQEGDTFVLDARLGRPLNVVIGERARFLALPGVMGSRMGVQIADIVEYDDGYRAPLARLPAVLAADTGARDDAQPEYELPAEDHDAE